MKFNDFFQNVNIPVIIYREDTMRTVVYENHSAIMQFNPSWKQSGSETTLTDVLRVPAHELSAFLMALEKTGNVVGFRTMLQSYIGKSTPTPVALSANRIELDGVRYVQVFVYFIWAEEPLPGHAHALAVVLDIAYTAATTDEAINNVLAFAGNYTGASRSYIFEAVSETLTSNTYEWCARGVEPAMEQFQDLPKDEYSYDDIIKNGFVVTNDVRKMPEKDRSVLEPRGIKAFAVVPIYSRGKALGYIGFNDCVNYRQWSPAEMQLLQSLADPIASLLVRRDAERSIRYSLEVLKTVTDNSDNIVFVSDVQSRELLFANSAMANAVGATPELLIGQDCDEIAKIWNGNSADYRPLDTLVSIDGEIKSRRNTWEFKNPVNGKWYLVHDSIIKWIDGKNAHIETAMEITGQKEYEAELKHVASTDQMTGLYNREWGRQLVQRILEGKSAAAKRSLIFIDLDGLKYINDTYGHDSGDAMIMKTIELIQARIRRGDTLCRWGGDEFVVIVSAGEARAVKIVEEIKALMEAHNTTGGEVFKLSFSYGVVGIRPDSGQTVDDIVKQADEKMYKNKMRLRKK